MSDEYEYLKDRAAKLTTSTAGDSIGYYQLSNGHCPKCGKPHTYVGDVPRFGVRPWCTCPREVSSVFDWERYIPARRPGLNPGNAKIAPGFDDAWDLGPARAAWECPRCHTINAPHVDRCDCKEEA